MVSPERTPHDVMLSQNERKELERTEPIVDYDLEKRVHEAATPSTTVDSSHSPVAPRPSSVPTALPSDDPESPHQWSTSKKIVRAQAAAELEAGADPSVQLADTALCVWILSLTYSSTAYFTSIPELMQAFNASRLLVVSGVTLFVVGWVGGPLAAGPMSEVLGRRKVYAATALLFSAFAWGVAFAPNLPSMLVFRFLAGTFGAASINNVPASIADFTTPQARVPYTVMYAVCSFIGPAFGVICGSLIERDAGFRWNLRVQAIFITVTSIFAALVPETHAPTLMKRRLKRQGIEPPELSASQVVDVYRVALSRPFIFIATEPVVTFVCLVLSTLYGILYAYFAAFQIVFVEIRGMSNVGYGLTYIGLAIGFLVGGALLMFVAAPAYNKSAREAAARGEPTPAEARLTLAYASAIVAPISLFLFAWTAPFPSIHWAVPVLAELLFAASMLCEFTAFIPYLVDCYLPTAASALAAGMASRSLVGGIFPLFAVQMYQKMTVQGATSLLAGLTLLLAPVPFLFKIYGPRLRQLSKYAVE